MWPTTSFRAGECGRFRGRALWTLALLAVLGMACAGRSPMRIRPGPVVTASTAGKTTGFMQKIAVVPFYPQESSGRSIGGGPQAVSWDSAALVAGFFSGALAAQGLTVISPNDIEVAFTGQGLPVPHLEVKKSAEFAAKNFGATAVVIGSVTRWREREGSAAGTTRPASVAFEVSLYQAPLGRRLWTGRFDETQQSITAAILRARQYPGGGTRWLSAAEFARWGAQEVAKSLSAAP